MKKKINIGWIIKIILVWWIKYILLNTPTYHMFQADAQLVDLKRGGAECPVAQRRYRMKFPFEAIHYKRKTIIY